MRRIRSPFMRGCLVDMGHTIDIRLVLERQDMKASVGSFATILMIKPVVLNSYKQSYSSWTMIPKHYHVGETHSSALDTCCNRSVTPQIQESGHQERMRFSSQKINFCSYVQSWSSLLLHAFQLVSNFVSTHLIISKLRSMPCTMKSSADPVRTSWTITLSNNLQDIQPIVLRFRVMMRWAREVLLNLVG